MYLLHFQSVVTVIVLHIYFSFVDVGDFLSERMRLGKWAPRRKKEQINRELQDDRDGYEEVYTFLKRYEVSQRGSQPAVVQAKGRRKGDKYSGV